MTLKSRARIISRVAAGVIAVGACATQPAPKAPSAAGLEGMRLLPVDAAAGDLRFAGAPLVDHHLHLLSPGIAEVINGRPLPGVDVPPAIAQLLTARGKAYNNMEALRSLYTDDAVVLVQTPQKSALYQGAGVAARHFSNGARFPYHLQPVSFHGAGGLAFVAGNYVRGEGDQRSNAGTFQLALRKGSDDKWRIASEAPAFLNGPPQKPLLAADAIALLDAAGIGRAVVLGNAGAHGGRYFDVAGQGETSAQRYARVKAENDWTIQQVSQFRDRLIPFCSFNPLEPYALEELRRCKTTGHRGLKMQWTESFVDLHKKEHVDRVREVFALANALDLSIIVHVGNNTGSQEEVALAVRTFLDVIVPAAPDVTIQVAHLWGGGGYSGAALTAYADAVSAKHPSVRNLYFDISEAPMIAARMGGRKEEVIQEITSRLRQIGLDRIVFGSDTFGKAHNPPKQAWEEFRKELPLTEDEFRSVAGNVAPYLR